MNTKQTAAREVMEAIREILVRDWDPIGVMDDPEWPRDEYDAYVGHSLLDRGEPAELLARHLCFIEEKQMGLGAVQPAARMGVAMKLKAVPVDPAWSGTQ